MFQSITPVLFVESVDEQLPFWTDRLGFQVAVAVPHDGAIGFAILVHGDVQLMLQSHASVAADVPALAGETAHVPLFIKVDDIDALEQRIEDLEKVFERRTTFYGATEVAVRDPAGNIVTFAQFAPEE